jgi:hypothetical protein
MNEAADHNMPPQLRNLFIMLLLHCQVADPYELFIKFEIKLMADLLYKFDRRPNMQPKEGSHGNLF